MTIIGIMGLMVLLLLIPMGWLLWPIGFLLAIVVAYSIIVGLASAQLWPAIIAVAGMIYLAYIIQQFMIGYHNKH